MEFERVKLDIDGPVGIVTLNHPEVMNAVSAEMLGGLMKALDHIEDPKNGVRCMLMTGAGRGFCAGANLQPSGGGPSGSRDAGSVLETQYHPFLRRLRELPIPFVTAVNGAAAGIGCGLCLGFLPYIERVTAPFVSALYALPKIALAPLFVILFGIELESKIVLVISTVFFLLLYNTLDGVRDIDRDLVEALEVMGATRGEIVRKALIPATLPWIFTGLRIAVRYAFSGFAAMAPVMVAAPAANRQWPEPADSPANL